MKLRHSVWMALMTAGMAASQTAPPSQVVAPASKPAESSQARSGGTTSKTHKSAMNSKSAAKPSAKQAVAKSAAKPSRVTRAAKARPQKPVETPEAKAAARASSRRDPFVSPIVRAEASRGAPCTGAGKKCLAVDQVVLRGIVRAPSGMIAVVESTARNVSYFLRENDPVFNGYVVKITGDSIVFRENVSDTLGRQSTRDVTKKVSAPAV